MTKLAECSQLLQSMTFHLPLRSFSTVFSNITRYNSQLAIQMLINAFQEVESQMKIACNIQHTSTQTEINNFFVNSLNCRGEQKVGY